MIVEILVDVDLDDVEISDIEEYMKKEGYNFTDEDESDLLSDMEIELKESELTEGNVKNKLCDLFGVTYHTTTDEIINLLKPLL